MIQKERSVRFKRMILEYAEGLGRDTEAYRDFHIPKSTFYEWKKAFREKGAAGSTFVP